MQPVKAVQQGVQIHLREVILSDGTVLAVVDDLGRPDAVAGLQIVSTQTVRGGLVRLGEDHGGAVHVVGAQPAHGAFAQAVVGHHAEEGAVHTQVCQSQRNVGLTAAVAGLKGRRHADLFVVRRGQTQHDLAAGDEFLAGGLVAKDGIEMFHNGPPDIVKNSPWILLTHRCIHVTIIVRAPPECKHLRGNARENKNRNLGSLTKRENSRYTPVRSKLGVYSSLALLFCCI